MKKTEIELDKFFEELRILFNKAKKDEQAMPGTMYLLDTFCPSYENYHSGAIAYLLNPKEQHKHGLEYLNLFIKNCGLPIKEEIIYAEVYTEKHTDEKRRIDIFIKINADTCIIIENKISAKDQDKQLADYYKYAILNPNYTNIYVLYLTLDGHAPSDKSFENEEKGDELRGKYCNISYREHIIDWLESLTSKDEERYLRSAVEQYLYTIKKLTGQTKMEKIIIDLFEKYKFTFNELQELENASKQQRKNIPCDIYNSLVEFCKVKTESSFSLEMKTSCEDFKKQESNKEEIRHFTLLLGGKYPISIEVEGELNIGIYRDNDYKVQDDDDFVELLIKDPDLNLTSNEYWLCANKEDLQNKEDLLAKVEGLLEIYKNMPK